MAPKFESALQNIRQGKFTPAVGALEDAADSVHGTAQAPMVLFWLAVAQEGANANEEAVRRYIEITTRYPKSRRAPLALLRQASVMVRLGDAKTAKLSLKKLVSDYPKSEEAARAKEKLKKGF